MSVLIYLPSMVHLVIHLPGSLYGPWWSLRWSIVMDWYMCQNIGTSSDRFILSPTTSSHDLYISFFLDRMILETSDERLLAIAFLSI